MTLPRERGGTSSRRRRGSALVLVLVMTLSMAGLAVSAVLLTSTTSLVQRFYDKDRDFRLVARTGVALTKATVQRDTSLTIPFDTAYRAFTGQTLSDASGTTLSSVRFNSYATYTGDTSGTYIPFLTVMAQAYDTLGTRSVQRLDLQSESFSRYAMFVDSFSTTTALQASLHLRGRVHGNRNWISAASPGSYYYDTLSVVGSISGTSTYAQNGVAVTGAKRIKWPTTSSLSALPTLASAGGLSFAPVFAYTASETNSYGQNISGENVSGTSARSGTRLRFKPVDVNNNGSYDSTEGFFEVFDLATGMDTANIRVDPVAATNATSNPTRRNAILLNQCGLMVTISGRREFFPVARFREAWVQTRVQLSTAPIVSAADATTMAASSVGLATGSVPDTMPTAAAVAKVLSYGVGYSRCFPAGSPFLMLTERYVDAACNPTTTLLSTPYAWGASLACTADKQYGGQDTTFTAVASRCYLGGLVGLCLGTAGVNGLGRVGAWRAFGGTSTVPALTAIQDVERPYLWPISTTYNAASRGVIYASGNLPLYVSDTLRGFATLYNSGRIVLINDLVYDKDPTESSSLCRNMLGVIADTSIKVANSALNFPREDPSTVRRFLGTPNFTLHGIMLALSTSTTTSRHGTVTVEDSATTVAMATALTCNGTNSPGGCWNHTGGSVMKIFHQSNAAAGTGLIRNMTLDPCQAQQNNRRPPFFPLTGNYLDYKWSEADTRDTDTWAEIKTYVARLRGNLRKVP
jgi:hypothetical protein